MRRVISNLREKPEEVRRHVLHVVVFTVGVLLLVLWVFSLNRNIKDTETREKISNDIEVFSELKDNLVDGYEGISN